MSGGTGNEKVSSDDSAPDESNLAGMFFSMFFRLEPLDDEYQ